MVKMYRAQQLKNIINAALSKKKNGMWHIKP